ncbi:MAG: outer membrane beta-barrel protein [Desulfobacula sp.]|jgi:opacity protein-like surface antigen
MKKRWSLSVIFFLLTFIMASNVRAQEAGVSLSLGINLTSYSYDLGDAIQTTPCHPGDMAECKGPVETGLDTSASNDPRVRLGFFYSYFRVGFEARWQALGAVDDYRKGIYETNKYPLPSPYESYAYTRMVYDPFLYMPYVGVQYLFGDAILVYLDVGFPFTSVTASSGWDRYGKFQEYQSDTQDITGFNVGIGAQFAYYELALRYESFQTEFAGEKATLSSIQFCLAYNLTLPPFGKK